MTTGTWQILAEQLAARGERLLVLIEGDHDQTVACARRILDQLTPARGLWVGRADRQPNSLLNSLTASSFRQHLGSETPLVVWDGWQGNPPDAVAAITGTLVAGGLWFWLMPPLDQWPTFADPDYARMGLPENGEHPFLARLARILEQSPRVIRLSSRGDGTAAPLSLKEAQVPFQVAGTADQSRAIDAIVRTGLGRRRRPLVMTADRGRGKSAALGIASVRLLKEGRRSIVVVSPRKDNVTALFRHATAQAGVPYEGQTELQLDTGATLQWLPVDDLLARRPEAELVLVDEAAAIPAPLLKQVLLGWPRVVFASTVHGYEGSGRGFNLRFRTVLDQETPHWQSITLQQPVRWADSDPLEPLVNRLFMLDAGNPAEETRGDVSIEVWSPGEADEPALGEAFGLLVDAHYRTSPSDLRQWMDDPQSMSLVARRAGAIVGVLWATVEGGLDPALAQQVHCGERRLKGHLLPQSLANHGGDLEVATLRLLRVVRVAVSDQCRRQGIGRLLLDSVTRRASDLNLDAVGTSYGAALDLLPFWQSAGFSIVRLGISRDASSGEYAVQMLRGISERGKVTRQRLSARFGEQWPVLLPVVWSTLSPALVGAISSDLPPAPSLTAQELVELKAFAHGYRGFEVTLPALKRLAVQAEVASRLQAEDRHGVWVKAVLQNQSWSDLQSHGLCRGRKDAEALLRSISDTLIGHAVAQSK